MHFFKLWVATLGSLVFLSGCGYLQVDRANDLARADRNGVPIYLPKHEFVAYVLGQDENGKVVDFPKIEIKLLTLPDKERKFVVQNFPSPVADSSFMVSLNEDGTPSAITGKSTDKSLATITSIIGLGAVIAGGRGAGAISPSDAKLFKIKIDGVEPEEEKIECKPEGNCCEQIEAYYKCMARNACIKQVDGMNGDKHYLMLLGIQNRLKNDLYEELKDSSARKVVCNDKNRLEPEFNDPSEGVVQWKNVIKKLVYLDKINDKLAERQQRFKSSEGVKVTGVKVVKLAYDTIEGYGSADRDYAVQEKLTSWYDKLYYGEIGVFLVPFDNLEKSEVISGNEGSK